MASVGALRPIWLRCRLPGALGLLRTITNAHRHVTNGGLVQSYYLRYIAFLSSVIAPLSVLAASGYICVTEHVAGLAFDPSTKQWAATTFKPQGKFVVQRPSKDEKKNGALHWVVKEAGSPAPRFLCKVEFNESGFILCEGFGTFTFNRQNNRFLSTHTFGYVTDGLPATNSFGKEGSLNPTISAGTCSEF